MNTIQNFKKIEQDALERLVKAYNPLEIYLYGKYAWGVPDSDDDLDFLVVIESSHEKVYKRGGAAFDALLNIGVPTNVTIFTKQEFETFCQDTTSLTYEIKSKGNRVYARN